MEGYITVFRKNHPDELDYWNTIMTMIRCLLNEDYMVKVDYEDKGLGAIRIEYGYSDESLGAPTLEWVSVEDKEKLLMIREDN